MDVEAFIERHPRLFHMAEADSWSQILEHGLLSTSALLDLYQYEGEERFPIESCRRPEMVEITSRLTGQTAWIRDNKVLREDHLAACLTDMTPRQWYENLNRRTFFWVSEQRLQRLLKGRAYRNRAHDVITLDTRTLVEREEDQITLAPINTGYTLQPNASPRGSETFKPISEYPIEACLKWRGPENAIVELAVNYELVDVADVALRIERRYRDVVEATHWVR